MSTDTGQMSRDELKDRIDTLERENTALEARVDALQRKLDSVIQLCIGERELTETGVEGHESLLTAVDRVDEEIDDVDDAARTAVSMAKAQKGRNGGEKITVARETARDQLVKQACRTGKRHHMTVAEVQNRAEPETELNYQTVKDAFKDLQRQWGAFVEGENESGTRCLKVNPNALSRDLTKTTERNIDADGLTKTLISRERQGGA